MIKRLSFYFFILFSFVSSIGFAQLSDKEKLTEALYLMDENRYSTALPILLELYEKDKENANINYNLGLAYLKSFNEKEKENALPFLLFAIKKASPNYSPFNPREKKAPVDSYFYLAKAQHNDYQFIEARDNLLNFKTYINDKHYLWKDVDKNLKMADYAQKAILNPVNIEVTNLGDLLNGYYPDFSPVVRIDETAIYFTSRRLREDSSNFDIYDPQDGMYYEDLYVSFKDEETETWGSPSPLNINTEGHEATVNLSIDGQTLYIYKDIRGNGELFESKLESDSAGIETWSEPTKLGSDINSKAYETHVTITANGKTLYFISDRDNGFGGKDIYSCNLLPTGQWALSQNAGPILNSEFDEDGVFMHPDGKTLFFSSNGHESMGGYDIMSTTLTDSGWTKPQNLGYPINSVDDDVFFVTTPDGKRAYFSSFKEEGYGEKDVYMLQLLDAEESAITLYRGEFTFIDSRVPPSGALVSITNNNTGQLVGYYNPRMKDGQFSAILETNTSYHFTYEADAYETYEEDIYVPASNNYQEIYKEIKLRPVRVGDGMDPMAGKGLTTASVTGGLMRNGKPVPKIKILLLEENRSLIEQTESDDLGKFAFAKLDPYNTYLIQVVSDTGNPILDYNIDIENNEGEILTFDKIDDNTYIFVPSSQPYEFYGISAKSISGKVKKAGEPIAGLKVRLEDQQKDVIQQQETDQYGEFNFQKLDPNNEYRILFDGDYPDDPEIILTNDLGQELQFIKVSEGVYQYVPVAKPLAKLEDIKGAVTLAGLPVKDLHLMLEEADRSVINKTTTDSLGNFNFWDLNILKPYYIEFEGDFPPDLKLVVSNEDFDLMLFRKIDEGLYRYDPNYKVRLVNENDDLLGKTETDLVNDFNFKKLNPDETYKIIYEGDFPDQQFIDITNEDGVVLRFNKVAEGVYEYVPVAKPLAKLEDIEGAVTVAGIPAKNLSLMLEEKDRTIISKTTTDSLGTFNFMNLDLLKPYYIEFEGDYPPDLKLVVSNEDFDLMLFRKIEEGLYRYDPDYKVRLVNKNEDLLGKTETDLVSDFNFKKLSPDESYKIIYEGDFPDQQFIDITNTEGVVLRFNKTNEGVYQYVPEKDLITAKVVGKNGPIPDTYVRVEDDKRRLISRFKTDDIGEFKFEKLNLDKDFWIVFEKEVVDDVEIIISTTLEKNISLIKHSKFEYQYVPEKDLITAKIVGKNGPIPNTYVRVEDDKRKLISRFKTDDIGEFQFKKLDLDKEFWIVFEEEITDDIEIIISTKIEKSIALIRENEREFRYVPPTNVKSYTMNTEDRPDLQETFPRPEELKNVIAYFQRYFIYNAKDINRQNKDFVAFINDIAELVKLRGYADLIITSSASKVPTKTWKTNAILTKKRAYDTKALLEQIFKEKGITPDQYNFVDLNTLITGPEYKGDYATNRKEYEKYQYVRIFVK